MRRWSSFFPFWLGIGSPHQAINFEATNYITKIKTALGNLSMLGGPLKSRRPELGFSGARFFFKLLIASYLDLVVVMLVCIMLSVPVPKIYVCTW